jgi:DNA polymerase-3 subunit alpha
MFKKVRFIGTHAAGVAVVGGDLLDYSSIEVRGNKTSGYVRTTAYDLNNLEEINAIKFDILGLRTLSITKELEELTDDCFNYDWLEDEELYDYFREGKTDGIFQLEKPTAKKILSSIETHNANDIIATSALNRPGPLQLKMPDQYAEHKKLKNYGKEPWAEFTNETYGAIVYQEQVQSIVTEIGLLTWADADKVLKVMKSTYDMDRNRDEVNRIRKGFIEGCKKSRGMSKEEALQLFNKLIVYSFNKGHSTGYSLISIQQMYYKVNYPELFWYVTLKYANDADLYRLKAEAVKDGNVILIPHVNYGTRFSIVEIEGENALAEGLINIKGVGEKAALSIEEEKKKHGKFTSRENFLERVPKRTVNAGTVKALEESGALVFDKNTYFERVKKYNSRLYMYGGM